MDCLGSTAADLRSGQFRAPGTALHQAPMEPLDIAPAESTRDVPQSEGLPQGGRFSAQGDREGEGGVRKDSALS
jgi:hypothetical protein